MPKVDRALEHVQLEVHQTASAQSRLEETLRGHLSAEARNALMDHVRRLTPATADTVRRALGGSIAEVINEFSGRLDALKAGDPTLDPDSDAAFALAIANRDEIADLQEALYILDTVAENDLHDQLAALPHQHSANVAALAFESHVAHLDAAEIRGVIEQLADRNQLSDFIGNRRFRDFAMDNGVQPEWLVQQYQPSFNDHASLFAGYAAGIGQATLLSPLEMLHTLMSAELSQLWQGMVDFASHPIDSLKRSALESYDAYQAELYQLHFFEAGYHFGQIALATLEAASGVAALPKAAKELSDQVRKIAPKGDVDVADAPAQSPDTNTPQAEQGVDDLEVDGHTQPMPVDPRVEQLARQLYLDELKQISIQIKDAIRPHGHDLGVGLADLDHVIPTEVLAKRGVDMNLTAEQLGEVMLNTPELWAFVHQGLNRARQHHPWTVWLDTPNPRSRPSVHAYRAALTDEQKQQLRDLHQAAENAWNENVARVRHGEKLGYDNVKDKNAIAEHLRQLAEHARTNGVMHVEGYPLSPKEIKQLEKRQDKVKFIE